MRIQYNAPVILTFSLLCTAVLVVSEIVPPVKDFFILIPPMDGVGWGNPLTYFRLFSHVIGHDDWVHLMNNLMFILLIGPILEEKYGSRDLIVMIVVTALVIGVLQLIFFPGMGLLGASGIVFMLILLASITNFQSGHIPITFILVIILYLGKEFSQSFGEDQVSQFAHIIGGVIGGIFGFALEGGQKQKAPIDKPWTGGNKRP